AFIKSKIRMAISNPITRPVEARLRETITMSPPKNDLKGLNVKASPLIVDILYRFVSILPA
ncbi:MAG: hypothetical protein AAGD96_30460, partial [Chloroflexota bacterium]